MTPTQFVLSWAERTLIVSTLVTPAAAQTLNAEQRIALEIGSCVIQRNSLAAENEGLKARIAALEKKLEKAE